MSSFRQENQRQIVSATIKALPNSQNFSPSLRALLAVLWKHKDGAEGRQGYRETDSLETGFMISTIIRETFPKTFREVFPHFTVKYLFTQKKVSRFKSNQLFFLLETSHLHRHCEKEEPLGLLQKTTLT